jgi:hypothetical protein
MALNTKMLPFSIALTINHEALKKFSYVVACPTKLLVALGSTNAKKSRMPLHTCAQYLIQKTDVSVRRILNTPRRGIGDKAEEAVEGFARRRKNHF